MRSILDLILEGVSILFAASGEAIGLSYARQDDGIDGKRTKSIDSPGIVPAYRQVELLRPLVWTTQSLFTRNLGLC